LRTIITSIFLSICHLVIAQTNQQLQSIETFSKLYGYVKYFHPSDEAAKFDWDRFAIYGAREVQKCRDIESLNKTLLELFKPIAPTIQIAAPGMISPFSIPLITPPDTTGFKVVTWQYMGLPDEHRKNIYKSGRLNRKVRHSDTQMFGTITMKIDLEKYRGRQFRLSGSVRLINGPGTGHLWARVDRAEKKFGFFDNMDNRPISSTQWKDYEINGTIDADAINLAFGTFLKGAGKLMVDNLNLAVLEENEWKTIYANGFESDKPDAFPNGMSGTRVPEYKIAVTDDEAGEGKKSVMIQGVVLEKIFEPLFKTHCKPGEIVKKEIGSGLTAIIPLALYGNENNTWPPAETQKLSALERQMENVSLIPEADVSTRVGGIISTWNVLQHFYPYFDASKTDWPGAFSAAIKETYGNKSSGDYLKTLRRLTAKLKDGHVNVSNFTTIRSESYTPPIMWEWIENELVITKTAGDNVPLKPGDIVTEIDGIPSKAFFDDVFSCISAATPGWMHFRAQTSSLLGPQNSALALKIIDAQRREKGVTLTRTLSLSDYHQLGEEGKDPIRELVDSIYYINIGQAPMEKIRNHFGDLQQAKAIICDLRGYPKNNHEFISHLLHENDTSKRWMRIARIIYPDQENITGFTEMGWELKPLKPHLDAKIFFLLDGRAISYAESFMSFIEHYDLATIVGQPSAGTNGNVHNFQVPGGYTISWTGMKVFKHDGSQLHGVGILPDVYVKKSIHGVRENKDEFLEKAIELARQFKANKKK
jgi:C-terminal processing protease CtpA/Prc